jgi:hypothetical protein
MTKQKITRILVVFIALVAIFIFTEVANATVFPPGSYQDPEWAPNWFKNCKEYKSWADWSFDYNDPPEEVDDPDNEGWNWNFDSQHPRDTSSILLLGSTWSNAPENTHGRSGGVLTGDNGSGFKVNMDNEKSDKRIKQVLFIFDLWTQSGEWPNIPNDIDLAYPTHYNISPLTFNSRILEGGWREVTVYWEIPQVDWEAVTFRLYGDEGNSFSVDNLRMLTQCIPEPGTLILLAMAGLMGLVYAYRRRK